MGCGDAAVFELFLLTNIPLNITNKNSLVHQVELWSVMNSLIWGEFVSSNSPVKECHIIETSVWTRLGEISLLRLVEVGRTYP